MEGLYGIMNIAGPVLLGAVLLWAVLNNRRSRSEEQRTEDATRKMYDEQNEDDKKGP